MNSKPRDGLSLDEQLCFALYRASQAIVASYRNHLTDTGLTYTQYLVMLVLWDVEDTNVSQISDKLGLDSGTLTPLLKRLEKQGLITRNRALEDERVVRIQLTDVGRNLRIPVKDARCKVVEDTGMTLQEIAQMKQELHRLANQIEGSQQAEPGL